jgi:RND family efflux transporter MFP subunit
MQLQQARSNEVAKNRLCDEDVATSRSSVQQAEAAVDVANEQVKQAKTDLSDVRLRKDDITAAQAAVHQSEANLAIAQRQLGNTQITAPISGVIASRTADPGQVLSPGQAVATVVDLNSVYLKGDVAEQALNRITIGQAVQVKVDALPGVTLRGTVQEVNPSGSTTNRNFSVRIAIPYMDRKFKPGMFARGVIYTGHSAQDMLIPKDAIEEQQGTQMVYTVDASNVAKRHVIAVVREDDTFAQLEPSTDLHIGDHVVTTGHQNLQDGVKVNVQQP